MNVSVTSSIIVFHDDGSPADAPSTMNCSDYLRRREDVERAAARASESTAARRVHQELARLMHEARERIEDERIGVDGAA